MRKHGLRLGFLVECPIYILQRRHAGGRKRGAPLGAETPSLTGLFAEHPVGLFTDRTRLAAVQVTGTPHDQGG